MALMTEEDAAAAIAAARAGRYRDGTSPGPASRMTWGGQVIDATNVDKRQTSTPEDEDLWVITPPWPSGVIVSRYEDVTVIIGYDVEEHPVRETPTIRCAFSTLGPGELPLPVAAFDIDMTEDGGFIGAVTSAEFTEDEKTKVAIGMAANAVCCTFDFCNSVNVAPAVPARPRATRRRIERSLGGETIKTLHIWRKGRTSISSTGEPLNGGVPLHEVRGHWAHYGDCCPGRHEPHGLLFGKYAGRVRKEIHLRGSTDAGLVVHDKAKLHG